MYVIDALLSLISIFRYTTCIIIDALLSLICIFRYTACMVLVSSCHWSASSNILHVCYRCPPVTDQHLPIYYMYVIGALLSLISIFRYTTCMVSMLSCHWSASSNILHVCYRCPLITHQLLPIYCMYVIGALLSLISFFRYTTCMLSVPSYHWSASSDILHVCYRCPFVTDQHLPIYYMYVIGALLSLISIFRYITCMVLVSSCHWSASSNILHVCYRCPLVTDQHLPIYYMYVIGALLSLISIFRYTTCMVLVSSSHWSASSDILHVLLSMPSCHWSASSDILHVWYWCPSVTDQHLPIYFMYIIGALLSLISIFRYTTCMVLVSSCHWSASSDILHVWYCCPPITDQHLPIYCMYGIGVLLSLISIFQYTTCMLSVPAYHWSASSDILHVWYWCPPVTDQHLPIYYMYGIGVLLSLISIFRYTTCMVLVSSCHWSACMVLVSSCHWSASSDILHVCNQCPLVTDQHLPIYYMYYYRCPPVTDLHLPIYCMYGIGVLLSLISIVRYTTCMLSVPPYHWSASSDVLHVCYRCPLISDQHLPIYHMYVIGALLSLISIFQYTTCMLSVPPITDQHLPIYYMYGIGILLSLISIFRCTTCMVLVSSCPWSASSNIPHVCYRCPLSLISIFR